MVFGIGYGLLEGGMGSFGNWWWLKLMFVKVVVEVLLFI